MNKKQLMEELGVEMGQVAPNKIKITIFASSGGKNIPVKRYYYTKGALTDVSADTGIPPANSASYAKTIQSITPQILAYIKNVQVSQKYDESALDLSFRIENGVLKPMVTPD